MDRAAGRLGAGRKRIAVIGTGVSGLLAAERLATRHDITVYEADDRIGGHTHTVDVDDGHGTIAVDTGSRDASAQLLAGSAAVDEIITLPAGTTFGRAVAAAERALVASAAGTDGTPPAVPEWLWLIHDDCAPEPEALRELLAAAQRSPSAAVLGPKARGWHDGSLLVQCGLSITNSGRAVTGLEVGDRDQGQRDGLGDVLAVGSAGML